MSRHYCAVHDLGLDGGVCSCERRPIHSMTFDDMRRKLSTALYDGRRWLEFQGINTSTLKDQQVLDAFFKELPTRIKADLDHSEKLRVAANVALDRALPAIKRAVRKTIKKVTTRGVLVEVFGPNLRDQSKGQLHVHLAGCGERANYGPNSRIGGEEGRTHMMSSRRALVEDLYSGQLAEGCTLDMCMKDVYFAPCLKGVLK